jgi:PAS domain S-box-containing protein
MDAPECCEESYYRAIIENALDVILVINEDGTIRYSSPSVRGATGYEPDEIAGRKVLELIIQADRARCQAILAELLSIPSHKTDLAFRMNHKDGSLRDLEAVGSNLLDDPVVGGVVLSFRDVTERLCAEENLRARELLLRSITDSMVDIVAIIDKNAVFRYISPSVETIVGYAVEDMIGKVCFLYIHPDDAPSVSEQFFRSWERREAARVQYRGLRADGSYIWLETYGTPILDDNGNTIAANLVIRDIDDRKKMEEALQESELKLRTITDNMLDMIAQIDFQGVYVYASPSTERILGYKPGELLGHHVQELFHPDDLQSASEIAMTSQASLQPARIECRCRHADGHYIWLETVGNPVLDAEGKPIGAITTSRDVTARKIAEDALRESEERFRSLAESTSAGIFIFSERGLCYVNPRIEEMTGYTGDELIGMDPLGLVHPRSRSAAGKEIDHIRKWNPYMRHSYELPIIDREGRERWLDTTVGYIVYEGEPAAICTAYDITERIRRGRKLEQLNLDLQAFAHTLSHDLKSPLSNAYGYAATIERLASEHLDTFSREGVRIIKSSLENMSAIIDGMLAYTRMGNAPEEDRVVDLRMMAEEILEELARGGKLERTSCIIRPGLPVVSGDPTRLRQVLGNLVSNAVKFGVEGRETQVEVGYLASSWQNTVYVRDNGRGIEKENLQKVFQPLERAGMGRDVPGHGLGLAIVQRAVESWGGRVWVESEPGRGSTFSFTLPAPAR